METIKQSLSVEKKNNCSRAIVKQLSSIARKQLLDDKPLHMSVWGNDDQFDYSYTKTKK